MQSNNGIIESLDSHYRFKVFTKHQVEKSFFNDVDGVVIGGGLGDSSSYYHLLKENQDSIRQFVHSGGKYIGICMGGYWAGSEYFNLLQGCDTVQYITRPGADTLRPHAKDIDVVWNGTKQTMFFYDGFAVTPGEYQTYAYYANRDPMAIIQNNVGIIGCHPEATVSWYEDYYSWLKGKYTNRQHQLLEFVNRLFDSP